jgi:hypothetical protein
MKEKEYEIRWEIGDKKLTITKEILEEILEKEDEMMPLIKSYLYKYLENAVNDEYLDDLLKQYKNKKEKEVNDLKEKITELEKRIECLETVVEAIRNRLGLLEHEKLETRLRDMMKKANSMASNITW